MLQEKGERIQAGRRQPWTLIRDYGQVWENFGQIFFTNLE